MFRSGEFIADEFDDLQNHQEQVQPNGVDLTVEAVYEIVGEGEIANDGKTIAEREEVRPTDDGFYNLMSGAYIVQYGEVISVPEQHVGLVYPRSSVMRNGASLDTAVWDAGYTGKGEGQLIVHADTLRIESDSRIAQFILSTCDTDDSYDGTYQNENL